MTQGYEVRCTEATAMKIKEKDTERRQAGSSPFQPALGVPLVTDEEVPEGHVEVRCNGVLVKRYYV
jgi:hypothetical protein